MIRRDLTEWKTLSGCWQRRRSKSEEDIQWWSVWYFVLATGLHITIAVRSFTAGRICTALASNFSRVSLRNSGDEKVNDLQGRKKKIKERRRERISALFGVEEFLPRRRSQAVTRWFLVSVYWRGFILALDIAQVWCHSTLWMLLTL